MIFALVARLAIWLLPHGLVRKIIVVIDDIVLIGLLLYFGYEMLVYLWNQRPLVGRKVATAGTVAAVEAYLPSSVAMPLQAIARALARLFSAPW